MKQKKLLPSRLRLIWDEVKKLWQKPKERKDEKVLQNSKRTPKKRLKNVVKVIQRSERRSNFRQKANKKA